MHDRGRETALVRAVHRLDPADFSAVMATGIVSEAMHVVGLDVVSVPLLVLGARPTCCSSQPPPGGWLAGHRRR